MGGVNEGCLKVIKGGNDGIELLLHRKMYRVGKLTGLVGRWGGGWYMVCKFVTWCVVGLVSVMGLCVTWS